MAFAPKMFDSEEEYIMDFKAEDRSPQLDHFHLEDTASDCSTISASEVDSSCDANDSTPPLFYKLKKVRVLIKKLPRDILARYNKVTCTDTSLRSSGRIKSKHNPIGKYLALHKNEPLHKVLKKGKRRTPNLPNIVEKTKLQNQAICSSLKRSVRPIKLSENIPNMRYSSNSGRYIYNKLDLKSDKNDSKSKASSHVARTPTVIRIKAIPPSKPRSLHERIATTRVVPKPTETALPNLPEVVITRYDVPPAPRSRLVINGTNVEETVPNPMSRNTLQHDTRFIAPYQKLYSSKNVQSKVFPAFITPAPSVKQTGQLMPSNANARIPNVGLQTQRKFTVQAFKIPNDPSKTKNPIPVTPSRVFVVKQPLLGTAPLNMPNPQVEITKNPERLISKENNTANSSAICVDSDSDYEQFDAEKQIEPEVIKRIIYHTKAVQTKFTCNSSICGLIDSDEFNLNCFYCYDIFPLHKWYEFKEHIKVVHHVQERANLSDSDEEGDNAHSQKQQENCSNTLSPIPRNENVTSKAMNTTQQFSQKLPLEPRLLAQKQNKTIKEPPELFSSTPKTPKHSQIVDPSGKPSSTPKTPKHSQIVDPSGKPSSTPKTPKPSQIVDQSGKPTRSLLKLNNREIKEVISLDSDDGDIGMGGFNGAKRDMLQPEKKATHKILQSGKKGAPVNDPKTMVLASMPHITIKKVANNVPQNNIDSSGTASKPLPVKNNSIKLPPTTSLQRVIKALPKPTESQLSANSNMKPRYFVIKKIIKLPTTDEASNVSDLNIPRGTILKKFPLESNISTNTEYADKTEDSVPKPTSGLGILFGLTNSTVVIEFLLKLKSFPELWRAQLKNNDPVKYNESIKKLCLHLNSRFNLHITDFEMLLSIQRVKDWYYLMLRSIHEHNKDPNNSEPYQHRFPIYFKILSQYLTPDADEKGIRLNEIINKTTLAAKASDADVNQKDLPNNANENISAAEPSKVSPATVDIMSAGKDCSQNQEVTADGLIEFDADTLYDQESSEEEDLQAIFFQKNPVKKTTKADGTERKRTKVYLGSFECDVCHKMFKRACDLRRHRVAHLPPQFECGRCSQKYYYKHMAEKCTHVKRTTTATTTTTRRGRKPKYTRVDKNSGEKRIWPKKIFTYHMICEICGNSYRSIGSLNTHKKDKHFNKRDRCIVCNFTALSNWRIVQHQRKRHIVEPGLPEDVAKKSRARTETKTTFSNEARQAFDWRREMRKTLKPGEKFFGCCRCKIVFNTRKEKVLHNKIEHPVTEETVVCLLCLPNKLLLSNANTARRHYIDIHKVPWHEIDGLVKSTKPIFSFLNKEEIELLRASENYKALLDELLKDKKLPSVEYIQTVDDEASKAVQNLPHIKELDGESTKTEVECTQGEENAYVFGVTDNGQYSESNYKQAACISTIEHDYIEEHVINEGFNQFDVTVDNHVEDELYSQQPCAEETVHINADIENNDCNIENYVQNDQHYEQNIVVDFVEGELVEESIVVEEYIDEIIGEDEAEFV